MEFHKILLTGSTGTVGQHVLFELLKSVVNIEGSLISLLVRPKGGLTSEMRIRNILTSQNVPDYIKSIPVEYMMAKIEFLELDLDTMKLNDLEFLKREDNICVIHCAASVSLDSTEETENTLRLTNYIASVKLLRACSSFVAKYVFVSTAFSCGRREGFVDEDYLSHEQTDFRNNYEMYKYKVEKDVESFCTENKIPFQIHRPSVVCGRLIDPPLFYTPKMNVFYGFTKFFHMIAETTYGTQSLRIKAAPSTSMSNVIPVDYVAKAIVRAINMDDIVQMNLVSSIAVPLSISLSKMIEINGFRNYQIVDEIPEDMNMLEAIYYNQLGDVGSPYLHDVSYEFDARTVRRVLQDIEEPDIIAQIDEILEVVKED